MSDTPETDPNRDPKVVFDVREIPGRVKHAQIFDRWLGLKVNEFFVLLNDHDPVPLRYQFDAEFGGKFSWDYLERGPVEYRVKITKLISTDPADDPNRDPKVVFDVREIPGRVKHAQIFDRWLNLPVNEFFVLLNDHDPVPLKYQFDAEFPGAFTWEYLERGPVEYRVKITKLQAVDAPEQKEQAATPVTQAEAGIQEIDATGLEPPEPLVRILAALEALPANTKLRARTDREPCHLFPEAEQRGFSSDCEEQSDGTWVTLLSRA